MQPGYGSRPSRPAQRPRGRGPPLAALLPHHPGPLRGVQRPRLSTASPGARPPSSRTSGAARPPA
eukprot:10991551-Alexandrium_andersonii.AAC.1